MAWTDQTLADGTKISTDSDTGRIWVQLPGLDWQVYDPGGEPGASTIWQEDLITLPPPPPVPQGNQDALDAQRQAGLMGWIEQFLSDLRRPSAERRPPTPEEEAILRQTLIFADGDVSNPDFEEALANYYRDSVIGPIAPTPVQGTTDTTVYMPSDVNRPPYPGSYDGETTSYDGKQWYWQYGQWFQGGIDTTGGVTVANLGTTFPSAADWETLTAEERAALQTQAQGLYESVRGIPTAGRSWFQKWQAEQLAPQYASYGLQSTLGAQPGAAPKTWQDFLAGESSVQSMEKLRQMSPQFMNLNPTTQRSYYEIMPGLEELLAYAGLAGRMPQAFADPMARQATSPAAQRQYEITPSGVKGGSFLKYLAQKYGFE